MKSGYLEYYIKGGFMESIVDRLNAKIAEKPLLTHPFYQAWQRGELTRDDLQRYATQYYFFEVSLPRFLSGIHTGCPFEDVRKVILENLWDEEHGKKNHLALWVAFCKSLGFNVKDKGVADMYPETSKLIVEYSRMCSSPFFTDGLAAIYAYEKQVPKIAMVKMEGLKQFYGITDEKALKFFTVHSELDEKHSFREAEALDRHFASSNIYFVRSVEAAADRALVAWWNFLDGIESRRVKS